MNPLDLNSIETSGITLIEASAGTGKTWTITGLSWCGTYLNVD